MALKDRLDEAPRKPTGKACSVGALLSTLPTDEAAALDRMMYELGWSQSRIHDALRSEGHEVGRQTINRHRSTACSCFSARAAS